MTSRTPHDVPAVYSASRLRSPSSRWGWNRPWNAPGSEPSSAPRRISGGQAAESCA
ncbi:hypothetical protein [Streptomyces lavendulae]